jgi:hypothetical protein
MYLCIYVLKAGDVANIERVSMAEWPSWRSWFLAEMVENNPMPCLEKSVIVA